MATRADPGHHTSAAHRRKPASRQWRPLSVTRLRWMPPAGLGLWPPVPPCGLGERVVEPGSELGLARSRHRLAPTPVVHYPRLVEHHFREAVPVLGGPLP